MNNIEFNKKFKKEGGVEILNSMMLELKTQSEIARHFGISKERIRQLIKGIFNQKYDPRKERRERKIRKILSGDIKNISGYYLDLAQKYDIK